MRPTISAERATTCGLRFALAMPFFLLAGCTTQLNAVRVTDPRQPNIPAAWAPYNLTFTQYEVTVIRLASALYAKSN